MIERYFAFGANVHPKTLARRGVAPRSALAARLDRHRLVFDLRGIPLVEPAFASVIEADDHVWGVLYELTSRDLERLRSFESARYAEVGVRVTAGSDSFEARTFKTRHPHPERPPSSRYLKTITEGARQHGLPDEWIARLEAHPRHHVPVLGSVWTLSFALVDRVHRLWSTPARRR